LAEFVIKSVPDQCLPEIKVVGIVELYTKDNAFNCSNVASLPPEEEQILLAAAQGILPEAVVTS